MTRSTLLSASLVLVLTGCYSSQATLKIVNASGSKISRLQVTVGDVSKNAEDFQSGKSIEWTFPVKTDADYWVEATFANGSRIQKRLGYLTRGVDFNDTIQILKADIELQKRASSPAAK